MSELEEGLGDHNKVSRIAIVILALFLGVSNIVSPRLSAKPKEAKVDTTKFDGVYAGCTVKYVTTEFNFSFECQEGASPIKAVLEFEERTGVKIADLAVIPKK